MNAHRRYLWSAPGSTLAAVRTSLEREYASLHERQPHLFELALNEAEAIAWQIGFPELIFAALAAEKIGALGKWHARQQSIRRPEPALAFAE